MQQKNGWKTLEFDGEGDHFQLIKERQEIDNLCSSQGAFWHLNLNDMIKTAIAF
jgi:hypothetical protein